MSHVILLLEYSVDWMLPHLSKKRKWGDT